MVGAIDKHSRDELEQDFPNDPAAILTEKGQQALSPYELIEMNNYTDKEFVSCLEYYNDRHFLHHPAIFTESGRNESKFITAKNPLDVYKFCKSI